MAQNEESKSSNRRREDRISGAGARFVLNRDKDAVICKVVNLSRLGLGVELPAQPTQDFYTELVPGAHVTGVLHIGKKHLDASAVVRVRRSEFLGLEYEVASSEFLNDLRSVLSPKYIASSIYKISEKYLSKDIETAYRGDEFECLVFKKSSGNSEKVFQFFAGGRFAEITGDTARFVPAPLIRTTGGTGALDFVLQFASLDDSNARDELLRFFQTVDAILSVWEDAPTEIGQLVSKQLSQLK